jgi:hypothetical protein
MEDNLILSGGLSDLNSFNPEVEQTVNNKMNLSHTNSDFGYQHIKYKGNNDAFGGYNGGGYNGRKIKNNAQNSSNFEDIDVSYFGNNSA